MLRDLQPLNISIRFLNIYAAFFKEKQNPLKHKNYVLRIHIFVKQRMHAVFSYILSPCLLLSVVIINSPGAHTPVCSQLGLLVMAVKEKDTTGALSKRVLERI